MNALLTQVGKIENEIAKIHAGLPHLPATWREFLAKIYPWLVLLGGVGSAFVILGLLQIIPLSSSMGATGYGMFSLIGILTILSSIVVIVVAILAFPRMRKGEKLGWTYLLISNLIGAVIGTLITLLSFSVGGLIGQFIGICIGLYFLFEIREHYKS